MKRSEGPFWLTTFIQGLCGRWCWQTERRSQLRDPEARETPVHPAAQLAVVAGQVNYSVGGRVLCTWSRRLLSQLDPCFTKAPP